MGSGVLTARPVDLPVASSKTLLSGVRGESATSRSQRHVAEPFAVVTGAPGTDAGQVVRALVGLAGAPDQDGSAGDILASDLTDPVDPATGRSSWVICRHATARTARAFVPGHRRSRPLPEGSGGETAGRPARRVELRLPTQLLTRVAVVLAPDGAALEADARELLRVATEASGVLVYVLDGSHVLDRVQLEMLVDLAAAQPRVVFVSVQPAEPDRAWRGVLEVNRHRVRVRVPALARAHWLTWRSGDPTAGVAALRRLLLGFAAASTAVGVTASARAVTHTGDGVVEVPAAAGDGRWHAVLQQHIGVARVEALQRLAIDLAGTHVRCVQELGSGRGAPAIPGILDRALHALSLRVSRQVERDAVAAVEAVLGSLLPTPPSAAVMQRCISALRRTVDELHHDDQDRERALLLTTTSALGVQTGPAALDSLTMLGSLERTQALLPPIEVALTASCYQLWQPRPMHDTAIVARKTECRRWVQQALRVVEAEVGHELGRRYDDLGHAITLIAADAVDHGVLLA